MYFSLLFFHFLSIFRLEWSKHDEYRVVRDQALKIGFFIVRHSNKNKRKFWRLLFIDGALRRGKFHQGFFQVRFAVIPSELGTARLVLKLKSRNCSNNRVILRGVAVKVWKIYWLLVIPRFRGYNVFEILHCFWFSERTHVLPWNISGWGSTIDVGKFFKSKF